MTGGLQGPQACRALFVVQRHLFGGFDCRARCRSARATLLLNGRRSPLAIDVQLEAGAVMHRPIDGSQRHRGLREDFAPLAERLIRRDHG